MQILADSVKKVQPDMVVALSKGCKFALWLNLTKKAFFGPILVMFVSLFCFIVAIFYESHEHTKNRHSIQCCMFVSLSFYTQIHLWGKNNKSKLNRSPYIIPHVPKLPSDIPISFIYGTKDDLPTAKFRAYTKNPGPLLISHELKVLLV
jgi:hypothetical protein